MKAALTLKTRTLDTIVNTERLHEPTRIQRITRAMTMMTAANQWMKKKFTTRLIVGRCVESSFFLSSVRDVCDVFTTNLISLDWLCDLTVLQFTLFYLFLLLTRKRFKLIAKSISKITQKKISAGEKTLHSI